MRFGCPAAFLGLDLAAAHDVLAAVLRDRRQHLLAVLLVGRGVGDFDFADHVRHGLDESNRTAIPSAAMIPHQLDQAAVQAERQHRGDQRQQRRPSRSSVNRIEGVPAQRPGADFATRRTARAARTRP